MKISRLVPIVALFAVLCLLPLFACAQADTIPSRDNNMAMGNPSHALTVLTDSNNYLIVKPQYALSYNNSKGMANWVSWHLSAAWKGSAARCNCFTSDTAVPTGYFRATTSLYTGTGFDRGHLCPSDDRDASDTDNAATFKMSNISPQAPYLNEQTWGYLEDYCRSLISEGDEMYIIAGGYGSGGSGSLGGTTYNIAGGSINVPAYFWKIILVLPVDTNDVARVTTTTRVITVLMPNSDTANRHTWDYYRVSVDSIQTLTGYNFFSNIDTAIQIVIEGGVDKGATPILAWDFTGASAVATWAATTINSNLDTTGSAANITRGSTAPASTAANSFRTTGFKNDGISTANTDYYQVQLKAQTGYLLSLSTIDATYAGTGTYCASPGASGQFAYSLDGSTFTLIGSPFVTTSTPYDMSTISLSGIPALQNLPSTQTVYMRYYASGQTTTGGWGFYSSDTGNDGLAIGGIIAPIGTIYGTSTVCATASITLTDATPGGVWSSGNTTIATAGSAGVITGVAAGSATISYTVSGSTFTYVVTVNPLPVAGTITGTVSVCGTASTTLSDVAAGGTWSSTNTAAATVSSTGMVTGVATGTTTISYTVTNSCGTAAATKVVTDNPLPVAGVITGTLSVCGTASTTLSDVATGGTWSSTNTAAATVSSTGMVTGVAAGTTTISYTVTNSCGTAAATLIVTDNPLPIAGVITGTVSVCGAANTTLSDVAAGGVWTSTNTAAATVSSTGIVTGVAAGTTTISYTVSNSCGTTAATLIVTDNPLPVAGVITGTVSVCGTASTTLSDVATGGVWTSTNTAAATVSSTGMVTGVAAGTTTISYTVTNSCGTVAATQVVTDNPLPIAGVITGTVAVCGTATTTLSDVATGGTWSSTNTAAATISSTGTVTGVATGTTTISYTVSNSCGTVAATQIITDNPLPIAGIITGTSSVCGTATTTLSDMATGGVWSSTNTAAATVSSTGMVTGVAAGTTTISYTVSNDCGSVAAVLVVTINPATDCDTKVNSITPSFINIYPNPANAELYLDAPANNSIVIYSADGRALIQQKNASVINISALASGMYLIVIYDDHGLPIGKQRFAKIER